MIGKPDTAPEVFFHISAVRSRVPPPIGAEVSFVLVRGTKRPQAANVELVILGGAALKTAISKA